MKKFLGIMAVVALIAVPVMADPPSADMSVKITVAPFCGVVGTPGALVLTASDVYHAGVAIDEATGLHQASAAFSVQGNKNVLVTLTTPYTTTTANVVPGGPAGGYPTFYTGGAPDGDAKNGIGVGVQMINVTTPANTETAWNPAAPGSASITFQGGLSDGKIKINTYIDSGRTDMVSGSIGGGKLAAPGEYTGKFILTLSMP